MAVGSRLDSVRGIGLGTAQFAFKDGTHGRSVATVVAALAAGIRLIDTALAYTRVGETSWAESVVHDALRDFGPHDDVVVATKGGHWRDGHSFPIDGSAATLRANCEVSLRTLGVETLDLYQLHHVDPNTPLDDSVATLEALRREGKIREIGLSNVSIAQLEAARAVTAIASVQNRFSFLRFEDLPMVRRCEQLGVRYLAYLPLDGPGAVPSAGDPRRAIAAEAGVSIQLLTLSWMQQLSTALIPLVGASRPATILDSARSAHWRLAAEDVATVTRAAGAASVTV
ncbi:MAG: aldo/keto reductase [Actinomycetota bacterium]|nr:aldo/keto reductase [Actinomycetota bacterium]